METRRLPLVNDAKSLPDMVRFGIKLSCSSIKSCVAKEEALREGGEDGAEAAGACKVVDVVPAEQQRRRQRQQQWSDLRVQLPLALVERPRLAFVHRRRVFALPVDVHVLNAFVRDAVGRVRYSFTLGAEEGHTIRTE